MYYNILVIFFADYLRKEKVFKKSAGTMLAEAWLTRLGSIELFGGCPTVDIS